MHVIIIIFLVFRAIDLLTSFLAPTFVPYLGFFPYKELLPLTGLPPFLYSFANFDGLHYIIIASQGYQQYEEAFFPLYPVLIHFFSYLTFNNYLIAGLIISHIAFAAALPLFKKYADAILPKEVNPWWTLIFLITFPTSFFFGAVYTESLFLLCAVGYLYFLHKRNYTLAGIFGFFAALTRLVGVFLIIPYLVELTVKHLQKDIKHFHNHLTPTIFSLFTLKTISDNLGKFLKDKTMMLPFFLPIAGLLTYMAYLLIRTGDPIFFLTAQPSFGANRSTELIFLPQVLYRYFKIFITATPNFQYFMSVVEFTLFIFVFGLLLWQLWLLWKKRLQPDTGIHLGINLFSMANMILPTLTGTLSSTPRYALMAFSIYFVLAAIKSKPVKLAIAVVFALLHITLLALFIQGYFIS